MALMKPCMLAAGAALIVAACAARPDPVGPWGYNFAVNSVHDVTPDDDVKLMNGEAFRSDAFARSWSRLMPTRVYGTNAAKLDVLLERYQATHSGRSYAVSMETRMRGTDQYGELLAETPAHCSAVEQEGVGDVGTFGQQVAQQRSLTPLTPQARDATMWQKALDSCVKDLAIQFGQALAAGRPAAEASR